jgi:predicted hotdog family 3-hydroxylacyl-ACP dehydratase
VNTGIAVRGLVPHSGSMCLLEEVVAWDAQHATVITRSHASPSNPLRRQARLSALCLCEYGAQAMAVHGALVAQASGRVLAPGLLVSLREVELAVTSIESLPGELRIQVERLAGGVGGFQYRFRVTHAGAELARGRAAVIEGSGAAARGTDRPPA